MRLGGIGDGPSHGQAVPGQAGRNIQFRGSLQLNDLNPANTRSAADAVRALLRRSASQGDKRADRYAGEETSPEPSSA